MKKHKYIIAAIVLLITSNTIQAQNNKEVDFYATAAAQTEKYIEFYKLNEYQAFRVDTMLQNCYIDLDIKMKELQERGASTEDVYKNEMDKFMNRISEGFRSIFDDKQWQKYMKSTEGRDYKRRMLKKGIEIK